MNVKLLLICFTVMCLFSCVNVINLDLPEKDKRLVIEGLITDQDTVYTVKLTKTTKYSYTYNSSAETESGALVIISDNSGNIDTLRETQSGIYQTNPVNFIGMAGQRYTLDIYTKGGKHYTSDPEEMIAVPKIDSIYYERDHSDVHVKYNAYKNTIYLNWQDPPGVSNYYLHHVSYFWNNMWHDENQWNIVFNDNLINGQYLKKYTAITEWDTYGFYLRITRYSLTKRAYEFWNLLYQQIYPQDDGIVTTSVPLIGNVYNVENPDDFALGYFQVSAKAEARVYIAN